MSNVVGEMTWPEVQAAFEAGAIAILPVGAVEAHGPHLPILTDTLISHEVAELAAEKLIEAGTPAVVLPPLSYVVAGCASDFSGTISLSPETVIAVIQDIAAALVRTGCNRLCVVNNHFDPGHIKSIYEAIAGVEDLDVVFPDMTKRSNAEQMTDEFKTASCHAGQYEGSLIMAIRPDLVQEEAADDLPDNHVNMVSHMREGRLSFAEMGMPQAYCGSPARATASEGERSLEILSNIVVEACSASPEKSE